MVLKEILNLREKNKKRVQQNLKRINEDVDSKGKREKTIEILKSLDYLDK